VGIEASAPMLLVYKIKVVQWTCIFSVRGGCSA